MPMKKYAKCPVCHSEDIKQKIKTRDFFLTGESFTIYTCEKCGILFTNPRPEEEKLADYYKSENYYSHNAKGQGIIPKVYRTIRKRNIIYKYKLITRFVPNGKILDIGCGTGEFLYFFKTKGWITKGVEPGEKARTFAGENYQLKIGTEDYLDEAEEKSFDVITLWHVLEHVGDINNRLNQINRLLKDEGLLVIALPNPESADAKYYGQYWAGYDVPRHLFHFPPQAFENLMSQYNLEIIEKKPLKYDAYYIALLSEEYKSNKKAFGKAFYQGYKSNRKAKKDGNYSSLIYLLQKKGKK
jgi:2-polyprenyl-3-methyl-5-hydroxy-6-metoxy-1,4-benzoquinol methylase